jgi:hypothetical protein
VKKEKPGVTWRARRAEQMNEVSDGAGDYHDDKLSMEVVVVVRRFRSGERLANVPAVSVETDDKEEHGEGMALGEDERGLRCAEGAEGVCCGAGVRMKSMVMATKFWRTGGPPVSLFSDQGEGGCAGGYSEPLREGGD